MQNSKVLLECTQYTLCSALDLASCVYNNTENWKGRGRGEGGE